MSLIKGNGYEVRAQVQLLRAYTQLRVSLNYQISQLKIKANYHQSNADYRDYKDMINASKILAKRFIELKAIKSSYDGSIGKKINPGSIQKLCSIVYNPEINKSEINSISNQNMHNEKNVIYLREKLKILQENYRANLKIYEKNQNIINIHNQKQTILDSLEEEIEDYREEVNVFKNQNENMANKVIKAGGKKKTNFDRIKLYQMLSENALKLRSKLLLREELQENLASAGAELEILEEKVNKDKAELEQLELGNEEDLRSSSRNEVDLYEMRKYIKKLELKIHLLNKEKDEFSSNTIYLDESTGRKINNNTSDSLDEGETYCISSLTTGFSQMKKEKDLLIEENNRLKDKISKLFQAKKSFA